MIVTLGYDGLARFERGLVRPEDVVEAAPEVMEGSSAEAIEDDRDGAAGSDGAVRSEESEADEGLTPLSERLVMDLTAHRTAGLQDALARDATLTLTVVVHAMALQTFYPGYDQTSPMSLRLGFIGLERLAPGVSEGPAGRRGGGSGSVERRGG